jgi:hypothetical protein
MKISTFITYSANFKASAQEVVELEKVGLDLVWVAEAYSFDSVSQLGYLAGATSTLEIGSAILPIYSRTPTLLGMTAAGLDYISDGRFHLGLGASGPQVIEGFHGVPYTNPIGRTREIIEICRDLWKREAPLTHEGKNYTIPLPADQGTGLGKALKIINHPLRSNIPIWIASLGDKNVQLTAELADGWMPILFIPEKSDAVWGASLAAGKAKRSNDLDDLMVTAGSLVAIGEGEDVIKIRELARPMVALYVGGMGAKGKNFYFDVAERYGYGKEAEKIQDLYLSGNKKEAEAAVPDEFLELTTLCGPESYVAERMAAFREAGVTHLQVHPVLTEGQTRVSMIETLKNLG